MAELKQGVEYEFSAKDNTQAVADAVMKRIEDLHKKEEEIRAKQRAAAKERKEETDKQNTQLQKSKSLLQAVVAAASGGWSSVAHALGVAALGAKKFNAAMMTFAPYAALVMAVAKTASSIADYFEKASERAEKIKLDNAASSLQSMKRSSEAFATAMERARKDTEAIFAAQSREVSALAELTKAYNEFAKAQELALAKTDDERKAIEAKYKSADAANARDISAEQRRIERETLDADIERMKEELDAATETQEDAQATMTHAMKMVSNAGKAASTFSVGKMFRNGWWYGSTKNADLDSTKDWGSVRDSAFDEFSKAHSRIEELKREIEDAEHRREMLDVKEEAAQYSDAAELQTELNEDWKEVDEQEKKEIEEIKEAAVEAAEEVKQAQLAAAKVVKDTRMRDLQEATAAEAAAQQRLAAARQAVDRAWGWYRDKDSLRAQIEEEKADAAARAQYEKDFDKLRRQRPDWEKAKNLSLDQEAVRRVALARREEADASRAVAETAENTRRAADALETIEMAFQEGGE